MPAFHCPIGAPFYEDDSCISCGMCRAKTREDMIKASFKIREYIRSGARQKGYDTSRKIAVCGKGGTGKSTLVVLLSETLEREGYSVIVMDADESNPGLHRMFGFRQQGRPLMRMLERFSLGEEKPDTNWLTKNDIRIEDVPSEYILECEGTKLLVVGKIEDPFQGCACTLADILREFTEKITLVDKELLVIDMEAGIESFGRGVERNVDTVLIVVEASFESLALAEKINYMAEGVGISTVGAILNKVPSEKVEAAMKTELLRRKVKPIGTIFFDAQVTEAGFKGETIGDTKAKEDMKKIISRLWTCK